MALISAIDSLLSVLTLIGIGAIVVVIGLLLLHRQKKGWFADLRSLFGQQGLGFAFVVAIIATLGSLFYSEIAGFTPCKLCWLQRIAMYPLSIVLGIAAFRQERLIWRYVLPPAIIGAGIALYHYIIQMNSYTGFCVADAVDCAQSYVFFAGFVSIPLMALVAFVLIIGFVLHARK